MEKAAKTPQGDSKPIIRAFKNALTATDRERESAGASQ
jgi:hypothetical protein